MSLAKSWWSPRATRFFLSSGTRLEADELTLEILDKVAVAKGHIFLQDQESAVLGDSILYNWGDTTGELGNIYIQEGPAYLGSSTGPTSSPITASNGPFQL